MAFEIDPGKYEFKILEKQKKGVVSDNFKKKAKQFVHKVGNGQSINEQPVNKDCVFLTETGNGKGCAVYPVRPNQCRTWPFWNCNLNYPDDWNEAGTVCPGINRGRLYAAEEIRQLREDSPC